MGHLLLITGESTTGKSTSLRTIPDHRSVIYLNCEGLKVAPFANTFREVKITDPYQIPDIVDSANAQDKIEYIVIDTLTYLLDMYVNTYVDGALDTFKAWSAMQSYFKDLIYQRFANSNKHIIVLAHTERILNAESGVVSCRVPVQGGLKKKTIESWFNNVISTKIVPVSKLVEYKNDMLVITEDDEIDGYKYVYQTRKTKDTCNEMIRGPLGMWTRNETYIDNDITHVISKLDKVYNTGGSK